MPLRLSTNMAAYRVSLIVSHLGTWNVRLPHRLATRALADHGATACAEEQRQQRHPAGAVKTRPAGSPRLLSRNAICVPDHQHLHNRQPTRT